MIWIREIEKERGPIINLNGPSINAILTEFLQELIDIEDKDKIDSTYERKKGLVRVG